MSVRGHAVINRTSYMCVLHVCVPCVSMCGRRACTAPVLYSVVEPAGPRANPTPTREKCAGPRSARQSKDTHAVGRRRGINHKKRVTRRASIHRVTLTVSTSHGHAARGAATRTSKSICDKPYRRTKTGAHIQPHSLIQTTHTTHRHTARVVQLHMRSVRHNWLISIGQYHTHAGDL